MAALTLLQRANLSLGIVDPANSQYAAGNSTTEPVALVFDVLPSEKNKMKNVPTKNPIETGAFINDHIWSMPDEGEFNGLISQAWPGGIFGGIFSGSRGSILQNSTDPVTDAYNYIHDKIMKAKAVFDFVSGLKVYQTYTMTECEINRDPVTSMALSLNFTLQEMVIVQTQVVNAPKIPPAPAPSAPSSTTPAENLGPQAPVPTTPAQQTENTAFLNESNSANGFLNGLFGSGPLVAQ
jgi:hypothetical protein